MSSLCDCTIGLLPAAGAGQQAKARTEDGGGADSNPVVCRTVFGHPTDRAWKQRREEMESPPLAEFGIMDTENTDASPGADIPAALPAEAEEGEFLHHARTRRGDSKHLPSLTPSLSLFPRSRPSIIVRPNVPAPPRQGRGRARALLALLLLALLLATVVAVAVSLASGGSDSSTAVAETRHEDGDATVPRDTQREDDEGPGDAVPAPVHPRRSGSSFGDVHLSTFDGLRLDCMASGHFILVTSLEDPSFKVEGLFATNTRPGRASWTTGVAVSGDRGWHADGADRHAQAVRRGRRPGGNVRVRRLSAKHVRRRRAGVAGRRPRRLDRDAHVSIPDDYRADETLLGLLGTRNGVPEDDWVARDGTPLPIPEDRYERLGEPAYKYCVENWGVRDESESIFTYGSGESFGGMNKLDAEYGGDDLRDAPEELALLCGDDLACVADGLYGLFPDDALLAIESVSEIETRDLSPADRCFDDETSLAKALEAYVDDASPAAEAERIRLRHRRGWPAEEWCFGEGVEWRTAFGRYGLAAGATAEPTVVAETAVPVDKVAPEETSKTAPTPAPSGRPAGKTSGSPSSGPTVPEADPTPPASSGPLWILVGAGSCQDAAGSLYGTTQYPADSASECESACSAAVPSSSLAGYHHAPSGLCYCNVAGDYLPEPTRPTKMPTDQPVAVAHIEPMPTSVIGIAKPTRKPVMVTSLFTPSFETLEPTRSPVTNLFTTSFETLEPTRRHVTSLFTPSFETPKPTRKPASSPPNSRPENPKPTRNPVTSRPTPQPETPKPTKKPDQPNPQPKTPEPTEKPASSRPTPRPKTPNPSEKPDSSPPTPRPETPKPTKPASSQPTPRPETPKTDEESCSAKPST
ncbi:hypothetical protein THAOC_15311, partial [Thalassiosira oceanica]